MKTDRDRTIAIAAVFQAAEQVKQVARHGRGDGEAMEASLYSLFQTDAPTVEAVFNGLSGVKGGLRTVRYQFTAGARADMEITRYVIQLLHLERKLSREPAMLERIGDGICVAAAHLDQFPFQHPNTLARLAEVYTQTVSNLQPKIMVNGEPVYLQHNDTVNRIRALLLAGIRAARLWRQCGGGKLRIVFGRRRIIEECGRLLDEIGAG